MAFPYSRDDLERQFPMTEGPVEQGYADDGRLEDLGRSDAIDEDDAGDIADEGTGRRG